MLHNSSTHWLTTYRNASVVASSGDNPSEEPIRDTRHIDGRTSLCGGGEADGSSQDEVVTPSRSYRISRRCDPRRSCCWSQVYLHSLLTYWTHACEHRHAIP